MSIQVFINFNGNCREAVEFYAQVFGCEKPKFMTYGEMPPSQDFPPLTDEVKKLILYSELKIAGNIMMFSDTTPFMEFIPGNNINVTVGSQNASDIKKWFSRLREGGSVHMEVQKTFWSDCYAMLTDKFGIPWQLSQEKS